MGGAGRARAAGDGHGELGGPHRHRPLLRSTSAPPGAGSAVQPSGTSLATSQLASLSGGSNN